jgi:HSP20 family protein
MREIDRFYQMCGMMGGFGGQARIQGGSANAWQPLVDIFERRDAILVVVEVPGADKDSLEVVVESGALKIAGYRPKQLPDGTEHVHQMEIQYGPFARVLRLPEGVDVDRIEAKYEGGHLTIEIPRRAK